MNIKQAAEQSGVSARNIRYYEQAGLLTPARNPENEYRVYSQADVRALKLIRMLRTLGADLVGMSTVHETIAARSVGAEVLGLSLVTNLAAGMTGEPLSHAEVLAAGRASASRMGSLLASVLARL